MRRSRIYGSKCGTMQRHIAKGVGAFQTRQRPLTTKRRDHRVKHRRLGLIDGIDRFDGFGVSLMRMASFEMIVRLR